MALTIGDFARLGGVSTRMLRHYDGLGLLRPDRVDETSGYRYYSAAQLTRLNRLIAFRSLGFSLDEIADLLDADPGETADRLDQRRTALVATIEADRQRLAAVDARLQLIADENAVGATLGFVDRSIPALRLMQRTGRVENAAELDTVIGPLFAELDAALTRRGLRPSTPAYAWYDTRDDAMVFGVGYLATTSKPVAGVQLVDLPAFPRALTAVHHGPIYRIGGTWQALAREAEQRGFLGAGAGREVYHEAPPSPDDDWVVELQLPVEPARLSRI